MRSGEFLNTSTTAIRFPGLGLSFDPPRVAFTIFGHDVMWYGVIIAVGFILAITYALRRSEKFGYSKDDLIDILIVATPVGIIGARLYYCLFYDAAYYFENPVHILYIWNGGLAIYGGIIFGLGSGALVALKKKIKPMAVLDLASISFPLAQAIGRWGNFMNREAFGAPTDLPWRMELYQGGAWISAHPCFLYESIWNIIGFVILHFVSKKRRYDGQIFLMYVAWYGLGRGIIEGLRTDSLYVFGTNLRVSQAIALITCLVAVVLLVCIRLFRQPDPDNMQVSRYQRLCAERALEKAAKASAPAAEHVAEAKPFTVLHSEGGVEDEPMSDLSDIASGRVPEDKEFKEDKTERKDGDEK